MPRNRSFSCLSGAALSANATLANTNICNGLIGSNILPGLDSPNSFRWVPSSSPSSFDSNENDSCLRQRDGFLNTVEVQVAGGAAGEDRVQAVCSKENEWLFCAIYDGFNGRDAADFLAGTLYESVMFYFNLLDSEPKQDVPRALSECSLDDSMVRSFRHRVLDILQRALIQAENDFLHMVEREIENRPDLVSVGSCVLVMLLHGNDLYTLNLGDSRAVLATFDEGNSIGRSERLKAIQLTDSHTVDNRVERTRLLNEHPDNPMPVVAGKVKGKLKVTRAFGVGYLKKKELNDALMGIFRVHNLISPPYISTEPSLNVLEISRSDHFVIVGSDGLFDFFSNEEAVKLVHAYIHIRRSG